MYNKHLVMNGWYLGTTRLSDFGAVTLLDDYMDLPTKRGDDIEMPYADGQIYVPKLYDPKVMTFGIEVIADSIPDLDTKMDTLKALLGTVNRQTLSNKNMPGGERGALVEVVGKMNPTRSDDPLVVNVVIPFLLSDPFLRSIIQTSSSLTISHTTQTKVINNKGTAPERKAVIVLTGSLSHPIITNSSLSYILQYDDTIAGGAHVTIDCDAYTAVHSSLGNVISKLIPSSPYGDPCWMMLQAGDNTFVVDDLSGAGGIFSISFYPPYL